MRNTIRTMLLDVEQDFCECDDGFKALEMYRAHMPRCVLMDLRMKHVDGIVATREIIAAFPHAHVIIVTEYDDPLLRHEASVAGAMGFVRKDDLSELRSLLR